MENARTEIVTAYRQLAREGLLALSSGNLSVRTSAGFLITPTGATSELAEGELVHVDLDGRSIGTGIPSSEWAMHAAIYRVRSDAAAVVHTHADCCTALSCGRRPIPAFHYMVALFGGDDIPCAPYAAFGSQELARLAAAALSERSACLLANHGMVCFGGSMEEATRNALTLEMLARQYILSLQAGTPHCLSGEEVAEANRRYGYYGRARIPES